MRFYIATLFIFLIVSCNKENEESAVSSMPMPTMKMGQAKLNAKAPPYVYNAVLGKYKISSKCVITEHLINISIDNPSNKEINIENNLELYLYDINNKLISTESVSGDKIVPSKRVVNLQHQSTLAEHAYRCMVKITL